MKNKQKKQRNESLEASLRIISAKILAVSELVSFQNGEPSLDLERVSYGLGQILASLSQEIDQLLEVSNE